MPSLIYDPHSRTMHTRRLLLRPLQADDAAGLLAIYGDPEVTRHYDIDTLDGIDAAERLLAFFLAQHDRFAVIDRGSGTTIGTCGLFHWERTSRMASVGYDLRPAWWGRGLMREAAAAVLAYGYEVKDLNRINALTAAENPRSARLLLGLGFREEAVLRQFAFWKGEFHDMRMFALLRRESGATPIGPRLAAFAPQGCEAGDGTATVAPLR